MEFSWTDLLIFVLFYGFLSHNLVPITLSSFAHSAWLNGRVL